MYYCLSCWNKSCISWIKQRRLFTLPVMSFHLIDQISTCCQLSHFNWPTNILLNPLDLNSNWLAIGTLDSNHNYVLASSRSPLQQQGASSCTYCSTYSHRLALPIIQSPLSAHTFFGYEIRLKITAVLNMEPIINLAVNKRKFCPDESLTLVL